jgi:uncharacterized delta-60 repeat protein
VGVVTQLSVGYAPANQAARAVCGNYRHEFCFSISVKTMLSPFVSFIGRVSVMLALLASGGRLGAQSAGVVDPSFQVGVSETVDGPVHTVIVQPDQSLLVAGEFTVAGGAIRQGIARLLTDGTADSSFDPGRSITHNTGALATIQAILLQADGKVLVSGHFTHFDGVPRNGLLRLHPDGTLDTSFDPGATPRFEVGTKMMALQPDGKILVPRRASMEVQAGLVRLNSDGSLDTSFEREGVIRSFDASSSAGDGKILAAGQFGGVAGSEPVVARLEANGAIDPTFQMDAAVKGILTNGVVAVKWLPDGKVLAWGVVTSPYWTPSYLYFHCRLVRLHSDGRLDAGFSASTTETGLALESPLIRDTFYPLRSVVVQPDGKILIAGVFSAVNGSPGSFLARLNPDGTQDTTFQGGWPQGIVNSVALQSDGSVVIGGSFTKVNNTSRKRIARLFAGGTFDSSFNQDRPGFTFSPRLIQPDGKILVSATFTMPEGVISRLARLKPDGTLDPTFALANIGAGGVLALQQDGKILWAYSPEWNRYALVRVNADGTRDEGFQLNMNLDFPVRALAVQPDGKILMSGPRFGSSGPLLRLNPDGSRDPTFLDPGIPYTDGNISAIVPAAGGKFVIAGFFSKVIGAPWDPIARLNPDGTRDNQFYPNLQFDSGIESIIVQPDGKYLIEGAFTKVGGEPRDQLARLNPDGSLDRTFNPGSNIPGPVFGTALQPDGKVLVGGRIDLPNGVRQGSLVRLNSDGTLDSSFNTGEIQGTADASGGSIEWVGVQPNGGILVSGQFVSIGGKPALNVARLFGAAVQPLSLTAPRRLADGQFTFILTGQPGRSYVLQRSPNLTLWVDLQTVVASDSPVTCTDPTTADARWEFYRVRAEP